jgi:hypothetical protein
VEASVMTELQGSADTAATQAGRQFWCQPVVLGAAAGWLNAVAYGFRFDRDNQWFELARVNWLRNPTLYPGDPITQAFARHATVFWPVVAALGRWASLEHVLFGFFLLTKALFFIALDRLLRLYVPGWRMRGLLLGVCALSPVLNDLTPLGHSDILNAVQTHTSLAMALSLWAMVWLLEGRWVAAAMLAAATIYLHALFFLYMLAAFAALAVLDWRERRRGIVIAGLLGAALALPWVAWNAALERTGFPAGYVEALAAFYPFHFSLRAHEPYELAEAGGLVAAWGVALGIIRSKRWLDLERLAWLAGAFLLPIGTGVLLALTDLPPALARLQLLRSDSFFDLLVLVLLGCLGSRWLTGSVHPSNRADQTFGLVGVLLPLGGELALLWAWVPLALWALRGQPGGRLVTTNKRWRWAVPVALMLALASFVPAWADLGAPVALQRLWNPAVPPMAEEQDWIELQLWAREHTPTRARFLVPLFPCGFRVFSERVSWGEWEDGCVSFFWPPFAPQYLERMRLLGLPTGCWLHPRQMEQHFRQLGWPELVRIAHTAGLDYVVAFRDMNLPVRPVHANAHFALYAVPR